ncbi:uncharacterized protein JCM15063_001957 [Sporobolomyces koalae]|uniref:uncharacterized protein n=1 Tax=Sporobolomyces koalae TaxID=500713 RepID=UPI003172DCE7
MPALNYEEDTEFNEALRKHGILPPKANESDTRSPSPPPAPPSPTLSELDLEDLDLDKDDSIRRDELERAIEARKELERQRLGKRKFGRVYPIGKVDYKREVTDASNEELEGEPEGWGIGVVCTLFKDYIPESKVLMPILDQLASLYPSTKFVKIVSDHCIENYPDKNVPTMLIYRKGQMMGQVVGLGSVGGLKATLRDVERILFAFRGIDFHNKVGYSQDPISSQFASKSDATKPLTKTGEGQPRPSSEDEEDDGDDSEDDQAFVGGGRRSGIRQGTRASRAKKNNDSDSDEFDL